MSRTREGVVLGACLAASAAWLAVASAGLAPAARTVPLAVAIPTLLLLIVDLALLVRAPAPPPAMEAGARAPASAEASMAWWLGVLLALVLLAGVAAGLPLYLLAYLRLRSREPWDVAIGAAAAAALVTFGALVAALGIPLYAGLAWHWVTAR